MPADDNIMIIGIVLIIIFTIAIMIVDDCPTGLTWQTSELNEAE